MLPRCVFLVLPAKIFSLSVVFRCVCVTGLHGSGWLKVCACLLHISRRCPLHWGFSFSFFSPFLCKSSKLHKGHIFSSSTTFFSAAKQFFWQTLTQTHARTSATLKYTSSSYDDASTSFLSRRSLSHNRVKHPTMALLHKLWSRFLCGLHFPLLVTVVIVVVVVVLLLLFLFVFRKRFLDFLDRNEVFVHCNDVYTCWRPTLVATLKKWNVVLFFFLLLSAIRFLLLFS